MAITVALAGDTMLGRGVAERLREFGPASVFAPEIREVVRTADVCVANLECCVSDRGEPWPAPGKPFFFRAPPVAAETLAWLGVDCATLANNHALDFGKQALLDTRSLLAAAGIASVGAGATEDEAREPVVLDAAGARLAVVGVTDHPADYAAGSGRAGVAFADLREGVPAWLARNVGAQHRAAGVDAVLVSPHWGPNMASEPLSYVREAAGALLAAGATFVAGHSAHVFHGVAGPVAYDLGDFVDDYRVDPYLRNDLGILVLLTLDGDGPQRMRIVPLGLDFCFTRLASEEEYAWITRRFVAACAALGSEWEIRDEKDQLVLDRPRP
ncbi:CapA family protein [Actinopolymorpha sp. B17G11]|uniref:CapA family protein n=1 Tax=Actinopolymorpha sp. B17G11 TaxID=3160861 RepID=UPI0032E3C8C5